MRTVLEATAVDVALNSKETDRHKSASVLTPAHINLAPLVIDVKLSTRKMLTAKRLMNVWSHRPGVGQMRAVKTIPVVTTAHVRKDIDGTLSPIDVKKSMNVMKDDRAAARFVKTRLVRLSVAAGRVSRRSLINLREHAQISMSAKKVLLDVPIFAKIPRGPLYVDVDVATCSILTDELVKTSTNVIH